MRDIFRGSGLGRCGLALIVFLASISIALGQIPSAPQKPAGPKEAAATPPAETLPPAPQPETTKGPEVAPLKAPEPTPAAIPAQGKGPKDAKGKGDRSGGSPTFNGVQTTPYVIGPEDILFLNVLHQADVTGQLNVRPDGYVTVRFAGDIKAAGLTIQQLTDIVTEKLTQYFNHPEVNIQVAMIRSKKYYLSGQARKPGSYTLSTPKTVLEAIIEGGGPADFAKTKKIYILRGDQIIPFNYNDVSKGHHLDQNILLQNGDVIVVP